MSVYRYQRDGLTGDLLRAGVGLALTAGPALAVPAGSAAQFVLLPLAALFLVFGLRTWQRGTTRVDLGPSGISISAPRQVSLSWHNLRAVRLSYYSTKSDRAGGWMQLTLKGSGGPNGGTIRIDSTLEGFDEVARHAARAARAADVALSDTTRANFNALGIAVDG